MRVVRMHKRKYVRTLSNIYSEPGDMPIKLMFKKNRNLVKLVNFTTLSENEFNPTFVVRWF